MQQTQQGADLPSLDTGINHVDIQAEMAAVHALAVNQLIIHGGRARWIDSHNTAATQVLNSVAPNDHFLDKVRVARAFTAQQHFALVEGLTGAMQDGDALLVLPEIDYLYQADDMMAGEGEEMLVAALEHLEEVAWRCQVPVLITTATDQYRDRIQDVVDKSIRCRTTREGVRFSSSDFETLVYPGTGFVQTTLAFWRQVLEEQAVKQKQTRPQTHG